MNKYRKNMKLINDADSGERKKVIYLCRDGNSGIKNGKAEKFIVKGVIGEGGSCVCYDAVEDVEKKSGNLKEFYPLNPDSSDYSFGLKRTAENHLVPSEPFSEQAELFEKAKSDFISSYRMLRKIMENRELNADFKTFIPDFCIYRGCDTNGNVIENSTVYIWTENPGIETFDKYIANVRKNVNKAPEHSLFVILNSILSLTECIDILHEEGLLHLDLKPSNFGILKRGKKLLTDSVSLFDVNTIYSLKSRFSSMSGTEGFMAPEVENGEADNRSDIYSIGCTLFSSIIITDEICNAGYSRGYFGRIPEFVENSRLIKASETNSNIFLQYELSNILTKCLEVLPRFRYQSCKELIRDLRKALVYLLPSEYKDDVVSGQKLELRKFEALLDKKKSKNSTTALEYHLHKKPLYEYLPEKEYTLNILIIGFGNYSQRFLDYCLQVGQMHRIRLNVKVVSNEIERDKKIYVKARPLLSEFFNINGTNNDGETYGDISFAKTEFRSDDSRNSTNYNGEQIKKVVGNEQMHYIFIAIQNDSLNRRLADLCVQTCRNCSVNFAVEDKKPVGSTKANPVFIGEDISKEKSCKELERMAFNAHLVWCGLNVDFEKERAKFKNPYNYNSSVSNAISVQYKLHSIGIDMKNCLSAAEKFRECIANDKSLRNELIAVEHRRWCAEKICEGYKCKDDFDDCAENGTKDEKKKLHMCLVKSSLKQILKEKFSGVNQTKWDTAPKNEIDELDSLDKASIYLHRAYKKKAQEINYHELLSGTYPLRIKELIKNNREADVAFSEWIACMNLISNGNIQQTYTYKTLKSVFEDTLKSFDKRTKQEIQAIINIMDSKFEPVLKSTEYKDYKQIDAELVDYIPFILTYREDLNLVIPFSVGNNTQIFGNFASASVINPRTVTYLCHISNPEELSEFEKAVAYVINLFDKQHLRLKSKIRLILSCSKDSGLEKTIKELVKRLKHEYSTRITGIKVFVTESDDKIAGVFEQELLSKGETADPIELNETKLSYLLLGSGIYNKFPYYKFNSANKTFIETHDCDFLRYIKASQHLKVSDMLAMKNSVGKREMIPEFYKEYNSLWKDVYGKNPTAWKMMCELLSAVSDKNDLLAVFSIDNKNESYIELSYIIPSFAFNAVNKIFVFLRNDVEVIADTSEINYYTTDSFELKISAPAVYKDKFDSMFSNPYILMNSEDIVCFTDNKRIKIVVNSLIVKNILMNAYSDFEKYDGLINGVIKKLVRKGFVTGYNEKINNGVRSFGFTYATRSIKELMTNAGRLLEIYVYHKCLENYIFNDIAGSYEICWNNTEVRSEFDCILTSGYRSLFVECKSRNVIEQDFYFKLSALAEKFGINAQAVLIADTRVKNQNVKKTNEIQILRGDMLDVITINDTKEIDDIGNTLAKIITEKVEI